MEEQVRNLQAERAKFIPKGIDREADSTSINGGIGDGRNDGGPGYFVEAVVDKDADSEGNEV